MRNLLTAISILFLGFGLSYMVGTMKPKPEKLAEAERPAIKVSAVIAAPQTQRIDVLAHGLVEASQSIDLIAEVSGRVLSVHKNFLLGGQIAEGEQILSIDDTQYLAELANAEAEVAAAEEAVATETARANQAKKEWRDLGSDAANALFLRKPQLKSAQSRLKTAKARLSRSRQLIERTKLTLPYAVNIVDTHIHEGQFVTMGSRLAELYRSDKRQVKLQLSQQQLPPANIAWPISTENPPLITLYDPRDKRLEINAELLSRSAVVDRSNQFIDLIVAIDNRFAEHFLPGLYIEARVAGEAQTQVFTLPENAFHDKRYILTADADNRIAFNDAQFLARRGASLLLRAQIPAGATIITSRLPLAAPGMRVAPQLPATDNGDVALRNSL